MARQQWISALTDLGGRNTLLYYKDRRAGTLDLAQADPSALERFLETGSTRLTRLFPAGPGEGAARGSGGTASPGWEGVDVRADAIRRMQAIYRKSRELPEERGIRAGYLATGLATWDELFLTPVAPVLLRGLTITPTRARYDDFDLVLDEEEEVNDAEVARLREAYEEAVKSAPRSAPEPELAQSEPAESVPPLRSRGCVKRAWGGNHVAF
jgi:hypothetical protein